MNRIKILREEKSMSQTDLGKIIGISGQAIGLFESEKRDIATEYLNKLATFFNVSIDYLLCKSNIKNCSSIDEDINIAFASGIKGLNETNKMIIKNTIDALLDKQEKDKNKK